MHEDRNLFDSFERVIKASIRNSNAQKNRRLNLRPEMVNLNKIQSFSRFDRPFRKSKIISSVSMGQPELCAFFRLSGFEIRLKLCSIV